MALPRACQDRHGQRRLRTVRCPYWHAHQRQKLVQEELTSVVPEDIAEEVRQAAEISMGTEITEDDEGHLKTLAQQVISIS